MRTLQAAAAGIFLAAVSAAQTFDYPDFSSIAGLVLNKDAVQVGNELNVNSANISEKGSVYYDQAIDVTVGFDTTFTFRIDGLVGGGADGMAFIIQNDPAGLNALGDHASAIGYGGFAGSPTNAIDNALVVELDTWGAAAWGDPNGNHISIHTGGMGDCSQHEDTSIGLVSPANMSDGVVHTMRVTYDGAQVDVYFDDLVNPALSAAWNFGTGGTYSIGGATGGVPLIGGTSAYVGFTAGNGGSWENHTLTSWKWDVPGGPIGTNYCGPAAQNSAGQPGVISAFGATAAADNNVRLDATQLALNQNSYFITSMTQGFVMPPGSQGFLCLGGTIGRFNANVLNTGGAGEVSLQIDLTNIPIGPGVAVQPGETWNFQLWYRDVNPMATSNFTDGISILFN